MGILKVALATSVLAFGSSAMAASYEAADNSWESNMCVAAATNTKNLMHAKVKDLTYSSFTSKNYKLVANKLYCNGMSVTEFARQAGNFEVAEKIAKYRKGSVEIRDIAGLHHGTVHVGSK